jgi:hypothetical protein
MASAKRWERATDWYTQGMVTRLQEAFEEVSKLPPDEQERWADWLLEQLESERKWDELFSRPASQTLLEKMAAEALEEHSAGLSIDLEELLREEDSDSAA